MLESLTLERVLLVAVGLILFGLGALGWGFWQWAERGFGPLPLSSTEMPPGWRSASTAEQVGLSNAVSDPGIAAPGGCPVC